MRLCIHSTEANTPNCSPVPPGARASLPAACQQPLPGLSAALDPHALGPKHAPFWSALGSSQDCVAAPGQTPPLPCFRTGLLDMGRKTSDTSTFPSPVASFILSNCQVIKGDTHPGAGSPPQTPTRRAPDTPGRRAAMRFSSISSEW